MTTSSSKQTEHPNPDSLSEHRDAVRNLVKCMVWAFLGLGVVLLAIYARTPAGSFMDIGAGALAWVLTRAVAGVGLLVMYSPKSMALIGGTLFAGVLCYTFKSAESKKGSQRVDLWVGRLGISGIMLVSVAFIGALASSNDFKIPKEDKTYRQVRAQISEKQAEMIYAALPSTWSSESHLTYTVNRILPEEMLEGMSIHDRAMLGESVRNLYLGVEAHSTHYHNCKRLADSYLGASEQLQSRMTLVINKKVVAPGTSATGLCKMMTFNSYQLGYSESKIFSKRRAVL